MVTERSRDREGGRSETQHVLSARDFLVVEGGGKPKRCRICIGVCFVLHYFFPWEDNKNQKINKYPSVDWVRQVQSSIVRPQVTQSNSVLGQMKFES